MSRFLVLMYHMISEPLSERDRRYACPPKLFEKHVRHMLKRGYCFLTLEHLCRAVTDGLSFPKNAVLLTFDDGYADNYDNALPVLERYGVGAVVFLVTGAVGGTNHWMKGRGFSERKMLSWEQVKVMSERGIAFGSHTVTHPRLNEMPPAQVHEELRRSRLHLEDRLGKPVLSLAYPYGAYDDRVKDAAAHTGYGLAFSTRSGFNRKGADPLALRRIEVYGTDAVWRLAQKIRFGMNEASVTFPLKYYWSRVVARWNGKGP